MKSKQKWSDRLVFGKGNEVGWKGVMWKVRDHELRGKNTYYQIGRRSGANTWVRSDLLTNAQ